MNKKTLFLFLIISISTILLPLAYAETQVPGIVIATQADPYYFSEGGFGIGILKYYGMPLTPYLTSQTTSDSSIGDILQSYNQASEKAGIKPIVDEQNRAKYYVVHFWNTSNGTNTFTTFSKFQPILTSNNPNTPIGTQQYTTGFSLESLSSKDKKWFYDTIINNYIKPGAPPPFNADVDIVTGDGSVLQTFQYTKCKVTGYVPFLSENLLRLQFIKEFKSEIRDRTNFNCDGFKINFDLRKSSDWSSVQGTIGSVPDKKDLVQKYVVTISNSIFKTGQTYKTFAKFTPMGVQDNIPLSIPTNPISGNAKSFSLESLPSKDKQLFYQYVTNELKPTGTHEPVDVSVDLVTGDGTTLQTWKYPRCDVTNYSTYRQEITAIWKFKQSNGAEIRDKTFLKCNGLQVSFMPKNTIQTQGQTIPEDKDRAQVFTIHFSGGNLKKSFDYTFLKFAPYSKEYSVFNLPDYTFGDTPRFYVESLPSKDKGDIYKLVSNYVTPSSTRQPFDATVDLTSGDGSVIQTWKYAKCDVIKYETYFQNILLINMFTEKYQPEVRDKIYFQCVGLSLDQKSSTNLNNTLIQPINFVSNDYDRALLFVVKFSNGDIRITHPFYSFGNFQPDMSASDSRYTSTPQIKSTSFTISSLPSKDKVDYYKFLSRYVNPTSKPQPFDASIDVVTGDGSVVETWQYQSCQATNYQTYLQNNLLYYTFSGKKAISETQDKTTFQCTGFSIKFDGGHDDLSQQQIIPSDDDRAIAYVTHLTSNVFTSIQTTGLVQEFNTLGNQQIQLESLPNKYNKNAFYLVSQYINPGVTPNLFDVTADIITGDGTKLYSLKYTKCFASDYSIYLSDNMVDIKFGPPIKSEIRGQGTQQCSGLQTVISQPTDIISPIVQKAIGIPPNALACDDGFQLMVRPPNNNTGCVKDNHVSILIQNGWQKATSNHHNLSNNIKPIIPTVDERAVSYKVSFQGSDISTQTIGTFSNFVPTVNSATNPSGSFSGPPTFYLQSLPSKDKGDLYKLISKYVNPGVKPQLFDVSVDVLSGNNSILQTWNFGHCQVTNYEPYLDENVLLYKYHLKWQAELKDKTTFSCNGLNLKI